MEKHFTPKSAVLGHPLQYCNEDKWTHVAR
jgi:hypothetical protein